MKTELSPPTATRRQRWPVPLLVVAVVLVVAAVVLGLLLLRAAQPPSAGSSPRPAASVAPTPSTAPRGTSGPAFSARSAQAAYLAIQRQRDEAYRRIAPAILRSIYAPDCSCLALDLRDLDQQRRGGYHFDGPNAKVRNVRVTLDQSTQTALIVAEVNYGASRYVDTNGNLRFVERNRGWQAAQTILAWDGHRWRVAQVVSLK